MRSATLLVLAAMAGAITPATASAATAARFSGSGALKVAVSIDGGTEHRGTVKRR